MYINGLQWVKTNYNKDNWTYTWEEGRQLASVSGNGYTLNFKYDDAGIRTQKTVNGISTNYHLIGDKVAFETNGTDNIYYTYGSGDKLVSMNLNGVEYYYIRNGQGDIIGLFDGAGSQVVSYSYDTWGKLLSVSASLASTVGQKNPYRYRGYRYDTETGLYYLQSRYYNPEWGRFMNADTTDILEALTNTEDDLLDVNLFAYCLNNPVNYSDPDGYCAILAGAYFIPGVGQALLVATVAVVAIVVVSYAAVKAGQYIGENISEAREKKAKKKKEAKKSQKETATDAPSWAKHEKPLKDETAEKFTKRILNDKYGEGKWKKGAGTEYSEIIKYATRKLGLK
ncbi:MAG: RHS repeat-associated core domain-containing protein [Clostridiaceae bacterium]|nr:RHS repeat-associated core domain-containing protein [Clostridiaceae bacterium]